MLMDNDLREISNIHNTYCYFLFSCVLIIDDFDKVSFH